MTLLRFINLGITGIIHVGAHEAQELEHYILGGCENVLWVEADPSKYNYLEHKIKPYPNMRLGIFAASNVDNSTARLNVASNEQSSSLLPLGTHANAYSGIVYVDSVQVPTSRVDTWLKSLRLDAKTYNSANIDVQGYELFVLQGMTDILNNIDFLEIEVNIDELYLGCAKLNDIDSFLSRYNLKRIYTNIWGAGYGSAFYTRLGYPMLSSLFLASSIRYSYRRILSKIKSRIFALSKSPQV